MTIEPQLHFSRAEFADRLRRTREGMAARGLDALLLFAPESHYWLTGYDTFGFCFFQVLIVPKDGPLTLLTRSADRLQALHTSIVEDVRIWKDAADADPTRDMRDILVERQLAGATIGVETDTHGLTAFNARRLMGRLTGRAELKNASDLISTLRLVKSDAEIAYIRRAAELGDACFEAARPYLKAGESDAMVLAAMQGDVLARGGDYPGNEFIVGSGPRALLCRYHSGRRALDAEDQVTLEWAGVYRRYHAALMRTVLIGRARAEHHRLHAAAREALTACEATLAPGRRMADVYAAHAETLDRRGFGHARLNACGYALGARFSPSWMESQMFHEGAPTQIAPNMVFFLHMILFDEASGAAITLGRSSLVTPSGAEPLSKLSLELDLRA